MKDQIRLRRARRARATGWRSGDREPPVDRARHAAADAVAHALPHALTHHLRGLGDVGRRVDPPLAVVERGCAGWW